MIIGIHRCQSMVTSRMLFVLVIVINTVRPTISPLNEVINPIARLMNIIKYMILHIDWWVPLSIIRRIDTYGIIVNIRYRLIVWQWISRLLIFYHSSLIINQLFSLINIAFACTFILSISSRRSDNWVLLISISNRVRLDISFTHQENSSQQDRSYPNTQLP